MKYRGAVLLLFLSVSLAAHFPASASDTLTGGQACQPMNLDIALKGLQWRSEGMRNTANTDLWVVCSAPTDWDSGYVDAAALVANYTNYSKTIQCLFKVTDTVSASTVRSRSQTSTLAPNDTGPLFIEELYTREFESISISCRLPSGTGVTAVFVEEW